VMNKAHPNQNIYIPKVNVGYSFFQLVLQIGG